MNVKKILIGGLLGTCLFFGMNNVKALDVSNENDLLSCVSAGGTCTLTSNIAYSGTTENKNIQANKDLVLDLNGYKLTDYEIISTASNFKIIDS